MTHIYLTGSHSSGKSTLLESALKDPRFKNFLFLKEPIVPFIDMGYMFKIPENDVEYNKVILSQLHLLGYAISSAEINIALQNNNFVMCDRSLFDVLSYIYFYAKDDNKINKLLQQTGLEERIKKISQYFNKENKNYLFLFQPVPYEDNGFRLPEKYVCTIHNMLESIYKKYQVEYKLLKDTKSIAQRIDTIHDYINN